MFYDNPQVDAYAGAYSTEGVDFSCINNVHGFAYRGGPGERIRPEHGKPGRSTAVVAGGAQDYDIGFTSGGNWGNYTRTFPTGVYNIFVRYSRGDGGNVADAGSVSLVTSPVNVSGQTTTKLGNLRGQLDGQLGQVHLGGRAEHSGRPGPVHGRAACRPCA